jgi:hypothetical protein
MVDLYQDRTLGSYVALPAIDVALRFPVQHIHGSRLGEYQPRFIGFADAKSTTIRVTGKVEFHITVIFIPIVNPSIYIFYKTKPQ